MRVMICLVWAMFAVVLFSSPVFSGDPCTRETVVQAVDNAVAILQAEGAAGLEKVGKLRFCEGNYVFVNDFSGKTLMHIKSHLIGKVLIGLKDDKGKRFFADFTKMAQSANANTNDGKYYNGKGWVTYRWPRPGEKTFSPKVSYVKGCLMGNQNVYVGAGIYE